MSRKIRGSPEDYILGNVDLRLEQVARHYLRTYNCGLSRSGICLDELTQIGRIAAFELIRRRAVDWSTATLKTYQDLEKEAARRGAKRIHARIVDFFRSADRLPALHAAIEVAAVSLQADHHHQFEARDTLEKIAGDERLQRLLEATHGAEAPTKASMGRVLGVDAQTIARLQCEARKKFD